MADIAKTTDYQVQIEGATYSMVTDSGRRRCFSHKGEATRLTEPQA